MNPIYKCIVAIFACLFLTSCLVPEEFTSTLNIDKNKQYKFSYDGTVAYGTALAEIKERGQLSQADNAEIKKAEANLRKEKGFSSVEYVGRGRFKVRYEESGPVQFGKKIFLDMIEFRSAPGGAIQILGTDISPENRNELSKLDLKLDGTLKVTSDIRVIEHNATSTPWFGGLWGAYEWHITLNQMKRPTIILQP
jgi:hypothetical protein